MVVKTMPKNVSSVNRTSFRIHRLASSFAFVDVFTNKVFIPGFGD
jgi:hypothetical protein